MFTYKYKFKPTADMRQHYLAYYKSGKLKAPDETETVEWMDKKRAKANLNNTVPSLAAQTRQILQYPETLWGGSFILDRAGSKLSSEVEEPFYTLDASRPEEREK